VAQVASGPGPGPGRGPRAALAGGPPGALPDPGRTPARVV